MAYPVTSPNVVKVLIGDPGMSSAEDSTLKDCISDATKWVERISRRFLGAAASRTEIRNGTGDPVILLFNESTSITSVEYRTVGTWNAYLAADYVLIDDPELNTTRLVRTAGDWPEGWSNIRVTYSPGYAAGSEPAELVRAVQQKAMHAFKKLRGVPEGDLPDLGPVEATVRAWRVPEYRPAGRLVRVA